MMNSLAALGATPRLAPALAAVLLAAPALGQASGRFWQRTGDAPAGRFARTLLDLGDQDGDGFHDVLAATPDEREGGEILAGAAYVLSGRDGSVLQRLVGTGSASERFGESAVLLGDLDGDGRPEFAVGAPGFVGPVPGFQSGAVFVYRGGTFDLVRRVESSSVGGSLGGALALAGDIDGDGQPDVVNGAPGVAVGGELGAGRVDAYSLATGALLWSRENPWQGPSRVLHNFGWAVATTADSDGDGTREVWVGSPGVFRSIPSGANVRTGALFRLRAGDGAVLNEVLIDREQALGWDVEAAGDFDRDGFEDVVVGGFGAARPGAGYVFDGRFAAQLLEAVGPTGGRGFSVSAAGDADGDGWADVAFADFRWSASTGDASVTVHSGRTLGVLRTLVAPSDFFAERFGQALAPVADLGGDGLPDLLVADPYGRDAGVVGAYGDALLGTPYCDSGVNSAGLVGQLLVTGRRDVQANDVSLTAYDLPPGVLGYFLVSRVQGLIANPAGSAGNLCLTTNVGRYSQPSQVRWSDAEGAFTLALDLTQTPTAVGAVAVQAGETWNFQAWHRDVHGAAATSNFTRGLEVDF